MRRRGFRRFLLEVIFLAGVAAALTVADLRPAAVVALMAAALLVVWLFEWASWLDEPHYGRGLPPRYYVPHVALPPPRPVEQYRGGGYPILQPDDAPTFVASTQEWAAALDWPVVEGDDTRVAAAAETAVVPLPPVRELEETVAAGVPALVDRPQPELEPDGEVAAPVRPLVPSEPGELLPLAWEPRPQSTVVHHVDPLSSGGRRRFLRRRGGDEHVVEVLDGPAPGRLLPSRLRSGGTERVG